MRTSLRRSVKITALALSCAAVGFALLVDCEEKRRPQAGSASQGATRGPTARDRSSARGGAARRNPLVDRDAALLSATELQPHTERDTVGGSDEALLALTSFHVLVTDAEGGPVAGQGVAVGPAGAPGAAIDELMRERWTDSDGRATFVVPSQGAYEIIISLGDCRMVVECAPRLDGELIAVTLPRLIDVTLRMPDACSFPTTVLVDPTRSNASRGNLGAGCRFVRERADRHPVERREEARLTGLMQGVEYRVSSGCSCWSEPFTATPGASVTVPPCRGQKLDLSFRVCGSVDSVGSRRLELEVDGAPVMEWDDAPVRDWQAASLALCVPVRRGALTWGGPGIRSGSADFDLDRSRSLTIAIESTLSIGTSVAETVVQVLGPPDLETLVAGRGDATVTAFRFDEGQREWRQRSWERFGEDGVAALGVPTGTPVMLLIEGPRGALPFYLGPMRLTAGQTAVGPFATGGFIAPLPGPRIGRSGLVVAARREDGDPLPFVQNGRVSVAAFAEVRIGNVVGPLPEGPVTIEFVSLGHVIARSRVVVRRGAVVPAVFDVAE